MAKRRRPFFIGLFLFLTPFCWAQPSRPTPLSLEDCIIRAIKHNLGVAVEVFNPEMAGYSVSMAREMFLPSLGFDYSQQSTRQASFSWLESSEDVTATRMRYSAEVSQLVPTGGRLSLSFGTTRDDTNKKFQLINPSYASALSVSFTQPLLKDFGIRTTMKEILVGQNNLAVSENELKSVLLETVSTVEQAYWNLVFSIETLNVRQQSLNLARGLLEKNQKEVNIGTLAPKEILSSQAEVAAREADILQAEAQVRDQKDLLRTLINLPDEEGGMDIIPVDQPSFEKRDLSLEQALDRAHGNRPDLLSSRVAVNTSELELSFAKNQLLPGLNLNAQYWSPGTSGDRLLYLNNDPYTGIIIGRVPQGASSATKDAFQFKYRNWLVSLTLDIPLNTVVSRAAHAQARAGLEQAVARRKQTEQNAHLEIRTALRAVETDFLRVNAYRQARELAEKKLEAEEAKFGAGLSTNFYILTYQRDLANARTAELKAVIDYNIALSGLDKVTGMSLERRNIKLAGMASDSSGTSEPGHPLHTSGRIGTLTAK